MEGEFAILPVEIISKINEPKIGESTLPHFAQWTKSAGMSAEVSSILFNVRFDLIIRAVLVTLLRFAQWT